MVSKLLEIKNLANEEIKRNNLTGHSNAVTSSDGKIYINVKLLGASSGYSSGFQVGSYIYLSKSLSDEFGVGKKTDDRMIYACPWTLVYKIFTGEHPESNGYIDVTFGNAHNWVSVFSEELCCIAKRFSMLTSKSIADKVSMLARPIKFSHML